MTVIRDQGIVLRIQTATVVREVPAGGGGGGGFVYVTDASPASDKVYQDPDDNVLQSFAATDPACTLTVRSSYPVVRLDGGPDVFLPRVGDVFEGAVPVTVAPGPAQSFSVASVGPDGEAGASDTVEATLDLPPQLLSLSFIGGYPGAQSELAAGDTFELQGTLDKAADAIQLQDFGAGDGALLTFPAGVAFVVTVTIPDRGDTPQALPLVAAPRDAVTGAFGPDRSTDASAAGVDGVNVVTLNNAVPTPSFGAPVYPVGQGALKNAEQATVPFTEASGAADTFAFDSPTGELSVAAPSTPGPKTVTRISGTLNESTPNLRATATRSQNGRSAQSTALVLIQNVAPTIAVLTPQSRLRSGGNNGTSPQDYAITLSSNQQLGAPPSLDADSGGQRGTFVGAAFAGGPSTWTRSLRVNEQLPDEKGVFTFENLVATNLAGLTQNTIGGGASYELGGFVPRDLTVAVFSNTVDADVETVDFAKLQAGAFSPGGPSSKQPIGTPFAVDAERPNQYTVAAVGVSPTVVRLLDTAAVNANSLGLYTLNDFEEQV